MTYQEQLKDKRWKLVSAKIKKRDNYKCIECGETKRLEVHHTTYYDGFMAWEHPDSVLITLCYCCHRKKHPNKQKKKTKSKKKRVKKEIINNYNPAYYGQIEEVYSTNLFDKHTLVG